MRKRLQRIINRSKLFSKGDLVLIYTMGKVGSTSIEARLPNGFHTHTLYGFPPSPHHHMQKFGRLGFAVRRFSVYPIKRAILRRNKKLRIVTFYRDPQTRNPSMFMQDLPFWLSRYLVRVQEANRSEAPDLLMEAYRTEFPHDYPQDWVRKELSPFSKIPAEKLMLGQEDYKIVEKGKYSVFVGRMENMDAYTDALFDFLGLPSGSLEAVNRGDRKWYAPLYSDFRNELKSRSDITYSEEFRKANGYT